MIYKIIIIFILLLFSAFFSGSETALFSLNSLTLRKMEALGKSTKGIRSLLQNPVRLLSAVLIGNILVNITASALVASISIDIWGEEGIGIAIGIMTFLLLLFGEVTPKTFAIEKAPQFSLFIVKPLIYFSKLIFPIYWCLHKIAESLVPMPMDGEPTLSEEELKAMIDLGEKEGVVAPKEREMVKAVLEFTDTTVKEVMTPRVDIRSVSIDLPHQEVIKLAKEYRHSKIPVYKKSIDTIMGVIYSKELFLHPERPFTEIIKPVLFVPDTKKIDEILQVFEQQKLKIAIVVGEYGGTDGLVTMEDILEEIFGEIYDEFETPEELIKKLEDGKYRIVGKAPIKDITESLGIKLPEAEYETLAGLVMDKLGKVPSEGEKVKVGEVKLQVEKMVARRITSIILER